MRCFHQVLVSKELGGAGLIGIHLSSYLQSQGEDCHIWIPGEGAASQAVQKLGLRCHTYDASCVSSSSTLRAAVGNWKMWRNLRPYRVGIVHIHSPFHYRALRLGFTGLGLKTIVHVHLQEAEEALRWAFAKPPEVIVTCARTLVEHVRHTLPEDSQQRQRIVAMPNAVDVERFYPGDKTAAKHYVGAPKDKPLVLMVANLAPHKGQMTAIQVTAALKAQSVDIVCWLAGTERHEGGDYTARLRSACTILGVADRVRFLGHRDDVPNLLRAADLFLLPSTSEGLPLSVLEAQATKVPVLAAPTAGIPEVITDGETGFLIPAEDLAGYAHRIENLLRSPDVACRVAERAYATTVQTHTWHVYCERVWELYQDVMEPDNDSSAVKRTTHGAAR